MRQEHVATSQREVLNRSPISTCFRIKLNELPVVVVYLLSYRELSNSKELFPIDRLSRVRRVICSISFPRGERNDSLAEIKCNDAHPILFLLTRTRKEMAKNIRASPKTRTEIREEEDRWRTLSEVISDFMYFNDDN